MTGATDFLKRGVQRAGFQAAGAVGLFVAMNVVNVSNFVFQLAMSRLLSTDVYGALSSLLGLITVIGVLVGALQAAMTQAIAEQPEQLRREAWARPAFGAAAGAGAALALITVGSARVVEQFLHLSSPVPVFLLALYFVPTLAAVVPHGILLGQLRFRAVALASVAGAVTRVATAVLLARLGFGLNGALIASVVASCVVLVLLAYPLRDQLGRLRGPPVRLRPATAALSVVALSGYSLLLTVDGVLARHYLSPVESGYYAAAVTASRMALYLPGAVAVVAFPVFAASQPDARASRRQLASSVGIVALLAAGAAVGLSAASNAVVRMLFGPRYAPSAQILPILAPAAACSALVGLLVYLHLARRSSSALLPWSGVAATTVALLAVHGSPAAISGVVLVVCASLLVLMLVTARNLVAHQHETTHVASADPVSVVPLGIAPLPSDHTAPT